MYGNISQILLLYKTCWYYNKFDYEIIGGMLLMCQNTTMQVYGAWIKTYYVLCPKHLAALARCHNPALVRDKPLGVPASVKLVYWYWLQDEALCWWQHNLPGDPQPPRPHKPPRWHHKAPNLIGGLADDIQTGEMPCSLLSPTKSTLADSPTPSTMSP